MSKSLLNSFNFRVLVPIAYSGSCRTPRSLFAEQQHCSFQFQVHVSLCWDQPVWQTCVLGRGWNSCVHFPRLARISGKFRPLAFNKLFIVCRTSLSLLFGLLHGQVDLSSSAIVTATEDLNGTLVLCWDDYYTENVNITMNIVGKHSEIIVKCTVLCFCAYIHAII